MIARVVRAWHWAGPAPTGAGAGTVAWAAEASRVDDSTVWQRQGGSCWGRGSATLPRAPARGGGRRARRGPAGRAPAGWPGARAAPRRLRGTPEGTWRGGGGAEVAV